MTLIESLRLRARRLKREVMTLYLALRDPRTPWHARLVGGLVVAYALSPIDLIPDFIPVLGLLDELVLVPIGIALTLRLVPPEVLVDARARAEALGDDRPVSRAAMVVIVLVWLALAAWGVSWLLRVIP